MPFGARASSPRRFHHRSRRVCRNLALRGTSRSVADQPAKSANRRGQTPAHHRAQAVDMGDTECWLSHGGNWAVCSKMAAEDLHFRTALQQYRQPDQMFGAQPRRELFPVSGWPGGRLHIGVYHRIARALVLNIHGSGKKKAAGVNSNGLLRAPRAGLEPATKWLTATRSAD